MSRFTGFEVFENHFLILVIVVLDGEQHMFDLAYLSLVPFVSYSKLFSGYPTLAITLNSSDSKINPWMLEIVESSFTSSCIVLFNVSSGPAAKHVANPHIWVSLGSECLSSQ